MGGHLLGVGITHCAWIPERVAELDRLTPELDREGLPFAVASTHLSGSPWSKKESAWMSIKALTRHARAAGWAHTLILAEDMLPAAGAGDVLRMAAKARPLGVLSPFCLSRKAAAAALARGEHWARGNYQWGSAFMLPTATLEAFIAWADLLLGDARCLFYEDELLGAWMSIGKVQAWIPVPCLFEHTMPTRSAYSLNNRDKVAAVFQEDVTRVDWFAGLERPATILNANRGSNVLRWLRGNGLRGQL